MKTLAKLIGAIVALLAAMYVLTIIASESGEVVVVNTRDAAGSAKATRLWVVDHDGDTWLRAGSLEAGWYRRLTADPEITVQRGAASYVALARPTADATTTINRLMNDKYGWADDYIGMLFSRNKAIAIRLEPIAPNSIE
jgi:F420H(2)-dependent quinone reductase